MSSQIQLHFALTFESPGGSPPDREDDAGGSTKGNQIPPIQRPDDGPIAIDLASGVVPRFDLYVTLLLDAKSTGSVETRGLIAPEATEGVLPTLRAEAGQ